MGDFFEGLGGGLIGLLGQQQQNQFNSAQASNQMDFQRAMSNTAHQREVDDLKAAGLNPILSATGGGGASTPSGAMATSENPAVAAMNTASAAKDLQYKGSQIDLTNAQIGTNKTQQELNRNAAAKLKSEKTAVDLENTGKGGFWNTLFGGFNSAAQALKSKTDVPIHPTLQKGLQSLPVQNKPIDVRKMR